MVRLFRAGRGRLHSGHAAIGRAGHRCWSRDRCPHPPRP
jgi:hypothetical protein